MLYCQSYGSASSSAAAAAASQNTNKSKGEFVLIPIAQPVSIEELKETHFKELEALMQRALNNRLHDSSYSREEEILIYAELEKKPYLITALKGPKASHNFKCYHWHPIYPILVHHGWLSTPDDNCRSHVLSEAFYVNDTMTVGKLINLCSLEELYSAGKLINDKLTQHEQTGHIPGGHKNFSIAEHNRKVHILNTRIELLKQIAATSKKCILRVSCPELGNPVA